MSRTAPQGIAVAFNTSSQAARATHAREGDLLLACAETKEGQEEIRQFRASPSLPVLAAEQLASTDCVLLELSGSIERPVDTPPSRPRPLPERASAVFGARKRGC